MRGARILREDVQLKCDRAMVSEARAMLEGGLRKSEAAACLGVGDARAVPGQA